MRPTPDDGVRRSTGRPGTSPPARRTTPRTRRSPGPRTSGRPVSTSSTCTTTCARELAQLFDLIDQVEAGTLDAGAARSLINKMTMRQNDWALGAYCQSYCRVVTTHHTIEDQSMFPHLRASDHALAPVIDRLEEEHHVIAGVLDEVDRALVAVVSEDGRARDAARGGGPARGHDGVAPVVRGADAGRAAGPLRLLLSLRRARRPARKPSGSVDSR